MPLPPFVVRPVCCLRYIISNKFKQYFCVDTIYHFRWQFSLFVLSRNRSLDEFTFICVSPFCSIARKHRKPFDICKKNERQKWQHNKKKRCECATLAEQQKSAHETKGLKTSRFEHGNSWSKCANLQKWDERARERWRQRKREQMRNVATFDFVQLS